MDYSISFARHFARLVWLLTREPQNTEEQKAALKATVLASSDGAVTLALEGAQVLANGVPLAEAVGSVGELVQRFVTHEVRELNAVAGATEADLLHAARMLAPEPTSAGDAGTAAERLAATGAQSVWFLTGRPTAIPRSQLTPAGGHDFHFAAPAPRTPPTTGVVTGARAMIGYFVRATPSASPQELLQRLDSASAGGAARALEDLIRFAETAVNDGKPGRAADALAGIVQRESATQDDALKELYSIAVTRLSTPHFLRALAALLPGARERTSDYAAILLRAGEKGADALIEELTKAQAREDLQVLFDVLLQLRPDASPFLHMLGDARWYVVRNAAEMLGTMKAAEADGALVTLLRHGDERVRQAAASALAQIDTPVAVEALQQAIADGDSTAAVREEAASALSRRRGERTSAITLARALDSEAEPQVQFAILAALGKVGTPEAIDRLIKAAEPAGILFSKKSMPFRIAAVRALAETRSPAALAALKELLGDRTPEVREAAAAFVQPKDGSRRSD
jgi:HEAT repeat protein